MAFIAKLGEQTYTVEIEETAVIEMRRMQVERVQPTGEPCAIAE